MNELPGLTSQEASLRLAEYGENRIPEKKYSLLLVIWNQLRGIFNLLLLAAAIITFVLSQYTDTIFIAFFLFFGVFLNVYQEHRAKIAAAKLKALLQPSIRVIRDGRIQEILSIHLVPGDLVVLECGDLVPADCLVVENSALFADETTFTGENYPVPKKSREEQGSEEESLLYQGTIITAGNGKGEVLKTGSSTRLAGLMKFSSAPKEQSLLNLGISKISSFILKASSLTLVGIILANMLIKGHEASFTDLLVFAIALSVSVIPEALPLVVTFSLSRGALEFAEKKVLVKRLSSIQDLGLVNLLCTDKTGTLTENSLHVVSVRPVAATSDELLMAGRFASTRLEVRYPEPFDVACDEALSPELRTYLSSSKLLEEEAFDPKLRSNGARWKTPEGTILHIRRGSPEAIASTGLNSSPADQDWIHLEEGRGHRVLALSRDVGNAPELAGYLSFSDRLKSTAAQTIQEAEGLNVLITIITGDSAAVAESVAREAGLVREASEVILAQDFFQLPLPERENRIGDIRVFARTTPEQKLELIHMLKKKYRVGYLGEGINDAPALRSAHVSMVVPSAADIAREASDIILLDSDLQVIVQGIRMGRRIHANIMKYIRGTLISNFGNFYAVAIGTLLVTFLPMLPRQLLLLNLLSDFPMISLAFDKVSEEELAEPKEVHPHGLYTTIITLGLVSTIFDFIFFALFFQRGAGVLQTNWFIASVLTELLLVFSIRSMMPAWKSGVPSGILTGLTLISMAAAIFLPYFPMTADFFGFQPPAFQDLLLIFLMTLLYGMSNEIVKKPLAKFLVKHQTLS